MPEDETVHVTVGKVGLDLPAHLFRTAGQPIDSASGHYEGPGISVHIDQGPFSGRLDSHIGRPAYREEALQVDGHPARRIFFRSPDRNTHTVALRIDSPHPVTVVVHADDSIPERVANQIIESLRLTTPNRRGGEDK
ncbi:MAG: hypothetical protein SFV54_23755 [Bryobacteraceae bacterium]|nr:hypothetical protein [Bryobacteraceae bacterium]